MLFLGDLNSLGRYWDFWRREASLTELARLAQEAATATAAFAAYARALRPLVPSRGLTASAVETWGGPLTALASPRRA